MTEIIHYDSLPGYDGSVEQLRKRHFDLFMKSENARSGRRHFANFAHATALRNKIFIDAIDFVRGLSHG